MQAIRQTGWMVVRQLRNLSRQPIWVVMMVVQPMIWLVLYGQLFSKLHQPLTGGITGSYVQFLAPGIICMNAFFGGMWSGMGMITDLDRKVIDRFLAAPASRLAIVLSQVVRAGITAMIQSLILLLVGLALGVRVHGGAVGWLVVFAVSFLLAAAFAGFSNGLALIFRRPESMIATANMVGLPLMFLSTILLTLAAIPGWIQAVTRINPVNWGVVAARLAVDFGNQWGSVGAHLGFLLAAMAVTSLFATWCFRAYQQSI
jgi:ABC-2 type transport system permease protein